MPTANTVADHIEDLTAAIRQITPRTGATC